MKGKSKDKRGSIQDRTLLVMRQTYNDVHRMDCDTTGHEQERYDVTSRYLKIMLIICPNNVLTFDGKCSAHSCPTIDSPICNKVEGNPHPQHVSFSGTNLLLDDVNAPRPGLTSQCHSDIGCGRTR